MSNKKHVVYRLKIDEKPKKVLAIGGTPASLDLSCETLTHVGWDDELDPHLEEDWTHVALFAEPSDFKAIFDTKVLWEDREEGFERRKMDQVGLMCNWAGSAYLLCDHYLRAMADKSKWLIVSTDGSLLYRDRLSWL